MKFVDDDDDDDDDDDGDEHRNSWVQIDKHLT